MWKLILLVLAVIVIVALPSAFIGAAIARHDVETQLEESTAAVSLAKSSTYDRLVSGWNRTLADQYADVVFFGDSLTEGGSWQEYFGEGGVCNLGVTGDTIECLIERMPLLETLKPSTCYVMVGVNDIIYGITYNSRLKFYHTLFEKLKALDADIYVESLLPVRTEQIPYHVTNDEILRTNKALRELAAEYGFTYVDVYSVMTDEQGKLKEMYSLDGLHINESGYMQWTNALKPYMN